MRAPPALSHDVGELVEAIKQGLPRADQPGRYEAREPERPNGERLRRGATAPVLLAVIGPRWLTSVDLEGRPRLENPDDAVRQELEIGLERGIIILPLLVAGGTMPSAEQLPESLAPLGYRQALELSDVRWEDDLETLAETLAPGTLGTDHVYVSSRRDDVPGYVGRIVDFLSRRLPEASVAIDVGSNPGRLDFRSAVERAIIG